MTLPNTKSVVIQLKIQPPKHTVLAQHAPLAAGINIINTVEAKLEDVCILKNGVENTLTVEVTFLF